METTRYAGGIDWRRKGKRVDVTDTESSGSWFGLVPQGSRWKRKGKAQDKGALTMKGKKFETKDDWELGAAIVPHKSRPFREPARCGHFHLAMVKIQVFPPTLPCLTVNFDLVVEGHLLYPLAMVYLKQDEGSFSTKHVSDVLLAINYLGPFLEVFYRETKGKPPIPDKPVLSRE